MKITEKNFVKYLKQKDENALEFVIRQYGGLMRLVIQQILSACPEDAEECLYDSFMKIWTHIDSYDEAKGTFVNWAVGIAKYTALDWFRRLTKLKPAVDIDQMQLEADTPITDNTLFNDFFLELIDCLNEEDKRLFIRIFWEGETIGEAAAALNKDKSFLYNRISRGKKRIIANNPDLFRKEE